MHLAILSRRGHKTKVFLYPLDEIQTIYSEACRRIVRQDYFREIHGSQKTLDHIRDNLQNTYQPSFDYEINKTSNNEVKTNALNLLNTIKHELEDDEKK